MTFSSAATYIIPGLIMLLLRLASLESILFTSFETDAMQFISNPWINGLDNSLQRTLFDSLMLLSDFEIEYLHGAKSRQVWSCETDEK